MSAFAARLAAREMQRICRCSYVVRQVYFEERATFTRHGLDGHTLQQLANMSVSQSANVVACRMSQAAQWAVLDGMVP